MVFRRSRRRQGGKRRTTRRRPRFNRVPRSRMSNNNRTYMFKRHVDLGSQALSNAATTTGGFSFQLDEVPNFTEFTALYDVYRIAAVKVSCMYNATDIQVQATVPYSTVRWVSVIDFNSSGNLGSFNDAREFQTAVVRTYPDARKSTFSRYLKPKFLTGVEDDSSTIVSGGNRKGWLNTAQPDIPHYGYRFFFEQLLSPYTGSVKFEAVYYLMFKQVK